jgi:hypothetical protein
MSQSNKRGGGPVRPTAISATALRRAIAGEITGGLGRIDGGSTAK